MQGIKGPTLPRIESFSWSQNIQCSGWDSLGEWLFYERCELLGGWSYNLEIRQQASCAERSSSCCLPVDDFSLDFHGDFVSLWVCSSCKPLSHRTELTQWHKYRHTAMEKLLCGRLHAREGKLAAYNTAKGSQGVATCDAALLNICDGLSMNEPPLQYHLLQLRWLK